MVDRSVRLRRALHRRWDEAPVAWEGRTIDPHFAHAPEPAAPPSGLWAELALDGIVLIERGLALSRAPVRIRREILSGRLERRVGHGRRVDGAMVGLGFRREGRHWRHPETRLWVEFAPGPVQVDDAVVTEFAERATAASVLRLLAPTECVMDHLAAWYHWNDPQGLDQALAVARRHAIDLSRVEAWSRREGAREKLRTFQERLQELSRAE